jgi:sulfur dioxygenase
MLFRQLFDSESSTYTYLLADPSTRQAVLIDPVREQAERDVAVLAGLELTLTHVLETHVHADHVTAAGWLRERTGCRLVASARGAACADLHVHHGESIPVGGLRLQVLATPGHTDDSLSFHVEGRVFTGDTLLVRGTGRTDFQNGDAGQLHDSITGVLFALPPETLVYPGHDYHGHTVTTIGEEQRLNPRLAGKDRAAFIALMAELRLPPPRKLALAVPANRACGLLPAHVSPAPIQTVLPSAMPSATAVRRIDVREPSEFDGPLGHLPEAELVPLDSLPTAALSWSPAEPLLLICRSGNRSLKAARLLAERGFLQLFNLEGGMLAVRETERAQDGAPRA